MNKSNINIDIITDEAKVPQNIQWTATGSNVQKPQESKALMLSMWDGLDKTALRIDLWVNDMMIDEMADFFYQTFTTMADTYGRATNYQNQVKDIKAFAAKFLEDFKKQQLEEQKA